MISRADQVAQSVLSQFAALPTRRKPTIRGNGLHEWVPLSGIVIEQHGKFECIALSTGMKCLPANKIPAANGIVLHDWHAEILAVRTFNRYLLDECQSLLKGNTSEVVEQTSCVWGLTEVNPPQRPFRVKDDVKILMYCTEAPCGDASMELTMAAQEDATPWEGSSSKQDHDTVLSGREFFSELGIVRRKPARRDAPPTLSKSCSDKLSLKQCTSLLSSLTALLISAENAYIETIVVAFSQYTGTGFDRAFSGQGRMRAVSGKTWSDEYSFRPFTSETTDLEFEYSKRTVSAKSDKISASNVAAAWSRSGVEETIVGGVIQGCKTTDVRGASQTSRRKMWTLARSLAEQLDESYAHIRTALSEPAYGWVKESELLSGRKRVKADAQEEALRGWVKNDGDSSFRID